MKHLNLSRKITLFEDLIEFNIQDEFYVYLTDIGLNRYIWHLGKENIPVQFSLDNMFVFKLYELIRVFGYNMFDPEIGFFKDNEVYW